MKELQVINHNGAQVIDSREVAEMIGKQHGHLLRDISGYIAIMEKSTESKIGVSDFFIKSSYKDRTGRELPCYLLTKKGCDMVANKMTGEKGVLFTAAYVTAFEQMREHIETGKAIPRKGKTKEQLDAEIKRADAMLINAKNKVADRFQKLWDRANVQPEYQALALEELFAGDGVKLPRIALAGTKVTYDKGTIADKLGILSRTGKPYAQAVGVIISHLSIEEDEKEAIPFYRNGHDGTDIQYTESVIQKVKDWLDENGYPLTIFGTSGKAYAIEYRESV